MKVYEGGEIREYGTVYTTERELLFY